MRKQRRFPVELKRQVVEELLSGITSPVQLCRRHNNHKRVLRVMRKNNLLCCPRRRWVKATQSDHPYPVFPNVIRNLVTTSIDQVWLADITYIRILTAFVYLAVILDMHSRKTLGYAISSRVDTELTLRALKMALTERKPPRGCIHHSDQGVQYAAHEYVDLLREHGFQISMSRRGNPFDNAMVESFFKTLKSEEVYLWEYETLADVEKRIPYFIEEVYNQKLLHSSLGYLSPNEFQQMLSENQNPIRSSQITLTWSVQTEGCTSVSALFDKAE
ncbi:MAG: IS3 family transposase [Candidatus Aenigmarchaeota archaeon]|nr:IS3 family transposase [Candidatus Aenigmarchaeota archaeon]